MQASDQMTASLINYLYEMIFESLLCGVLVQ